LHQSSVHTLARPDTDNRIISVSLVAGYLFFVVYGSLIPFSWNGLAFDTAWENFQHIPLLTLRVASRADLVANLLLYMPLGFLTCGLLTGRNRDSLVLAAGIILSLLFSTTIALSVEFIQQFFSPRTVSLNDIYAELAGSLLGTLLWPITGMRLREMAFNLLRGGKNAQHAALIIYALAYLVLSFFPYDFLLSYDEWQQKLASGLAGWLFAPACGSSCTLKLIPEALMTIPLAMLLSRSVQRTSLVLAALTGAMLGIFIEGLQLTVASGISQGASVISRMAGMMLGTVLMRILPTINWQQFRPYVRYLLLLASAPYLGILAYINYWFSGNWLGLTEGMERSGEIHFLPFYYHYFTTELAALVSLLLQAGAYIPAGIGFWIWRRTNRPVNMKHHSILWPGVIAGTLSCVIEAGKLFIPATHPDPTNILIAVVSASLACRLFDLLFPDKPDISSDSNHVNILPIQGNDDKTTGWTSELNEIPARHRQPSPRLTSSPAPSPATTTILTGLQKYPLRHRPVWLILTGAVALLVAGMAAATSPLGAVWVLLPLVIYSVLLWWRPDLWLVWVLASLPLLDLTPWSGRLYWTEYDTLLLATAGIGYLRLWPHPYPHPVLRRPAAILLTLFVISAVISLGISLFPLSPPDYNAFSSYYSSYNGLRSIKGFLFSLIFIPLLVREWNNPGLAARRLASGMSLGLAAEILYILWERVTFPGLFNFETDYRITGSFHGMHVGGAYIEGYLILAAPFIVLRAWQQRNTLATLLAVGLYCLDAYCVMVTFSRGGQIAFGLITVLLAIGLPGFVLRKRTHIFSNAIIAILVIGVAGAVAWPIISGSYSQSRFATMEKDAVTRVSHWQKAIDIVLQQGDPVFGVGPGLFPSTFFWHSNILTRPSTYTFTTENRNIFLQLGGGGLLYFEQPVAVEPKQHYVLTMDLRSQTQAAAITASVCEKALLYSFNCTGQIIQLDKVPAGQWGRYTIELFTDKFNRSNSRIKRPVKLSLYNGQPGTVIAIDNISLKSSNGSELVNNGDFSDGMFHWFFSIDDHLYWHIENLYVHVFFEQGWFGLSCFIALAGYLLIRGSARAWHGDSFSLFLCISLGVFLILGILNTLTDEPRIAFLFYFLLIAGLVADAHPIPPPSTRTSDKVFHNGR